MPLLTDFKPDFYQVTQHKNTYSDVLCKSMHAKGFHQDLQQQFKGAWAGPQLFHLKTSHPKECYQPQPRLCLTWAAATDVAEQMSGFVTGWHLWYSGKKIFKALYKNECFYFLIVRQKMRAKKVISIVKEAEDSGC